MPAPVVRGGGVVSGMEGCLDVANLGFVVASSVTICGLLMDRIAVGNGYGSGVRRRLVEMSGVVHDGWLYARTRQSSESKMEMKARETTHGVVVDPVAVWARTLGGRRGSVGVGGGIETA